MLLRIKSGLSIAFALVVIIGVGWLTFLGMRGVWRTLASVNQTLAVAVIAGAATVIGSTVTVMLGRYFERKREIEAHFRAEKIKIYDEFLGEFFKIFHSDSEAASEQMVQFLREWQRKVLLWGGSNVLASYFVWMNRLKRGQPDAQTVFLMDEFFRALRSDIGQNSHGLPRGVFANLILRHGDFFMAEAKRNPAITLEQLSILEKERFGKGPG